MINYSQEYVTRNSPDDDDQTYRRIKAKVIAVHALTLERVTEETTGQEK